MQSQNKRLLKALKDSPLTTLEIIRFGGIIRPAARVNELRQMGHAVKTTMVTVQNKWGDDCRVARYSI